MFNIYYRGDKLQAVATMGSDPVAATVAECFRIRKTITKADIEK